VARPFPPETNGRTYSVTRLRVVLILLTLITLPVVFGSSVFIYMYVRYSVLVDRRLKGERWAVPSRVYAQPTVLRPGLPMDEAGLVSLLNGLRYEQRPSAVAQPGEFAIVSPETLVFFPRAVGGAAHEALNVIFDKQKIREMRGAGSRATYLEQALEPELITYLFDESREKRRLVRYEDVPENLVQAVLAIEDRRFFSHPGLDPFRIIGAAVRNLRADSYIQGGSTITQQLVKNFFLTPERTMKRKAAEAMIAFVLERRATKKEILELYLNEIYLGQLGSFGVKGVGEAARVYFHKDVANLTLTECALLAGMIQSPNGYNPYRHAEKAKERRNQVLRAMVDSEYIDTKAAEAARALPLRVESPILDTAEAPYFVDLVKSQLGDRWKDLPSQNLSIYTTLDLRMQSFAQQALRSGLEQIDKIVAKRKKAPAEPVQGCLIAIEPKTGAVVAMVGGRSYGASQFNRVTQARRQPGSTFKPFVYLAAFEKTFEDPAAPPLTPATLVDDVPWTFTFEKKDYVPENYEDKYMGSVTLRTALAHSLNVATVKVAEIVGYETIANLWSKKLKMSSEIHPYPAIALGSFEATPLEMATAYNVLASGGLRIPPVTVLKIADEREAVLEDHGAPPPDRVVHEESTVLVTHMLRSVLTEGTGASARTMGFTLDAAGKTGTTNDMRDAWFAGYTPDLLCVVWVGFDDNTPLNLTGARAALPIWVDFMKRASAGTRPTPFSVPESGVVFMDIDKDTGLLATPSCPRVISEAFIAGTEPMERCAAHASDYGRGNRD
jgi:penicillin-binding protein 1B